MPLVLLAGCGGASHSASTPSTAAAPAKSTATRSPKRSAHQKSQRPARQTTKRAAGHATKSNRHAGRPTQTTQIATKPQPAPTHVRIPATFTVTASGTLTPPVITVPAALPIEVTVTSGDGNPHRVELGTPAPHSFSVPAGGKGSVLVSKLHKGTYPVDVDGSPKGSLLVGAAPGP